MECLIDGLPMYYEEYGVGKPILCLHGYLVDHRLMKGAIEPILSNTSGYRRIYLDLPGMGKSVVSESVTTTDDYLEIIIKFINEIITEKDFLIAAQSFGGYLALGLTYLMPERVGGLFAISPAFTSKVSENKARKEIVWEEKIVDIDDDKQFELFRKQAVIVSETTWKRYQEEYLSGILMAKQQFLSEYRKRGYELSFEAEMRAMIFDKPATVLVGKQDDVVNVADMLFYLDNFKQGTFAIIDGSGHNFTLEQPEILNAYLKAFLVRVEQFE